MTLINSTTVLISWTPPFTLEGVPILGYNVTITNTTSGENETMLVEDTTLLYTVYRKYIKITVIVIPINEIGAGEPADVTLEIPLPSTTMDPLTSVPGTIQALSKRAYLTTWAHIFMHDYLLHRCSKTFSVHVVYYSVILYIYHSTVVSYTS